MSFKEVKGKNCGCIYMITNLANGKRYVGQSKYSAESRFNQHMNAAFQKTYSNSNIILYKAIRKYGKENFVFEELEDVNCNSPEELKDKLNELEVYHIAKQNTLKPNGYNMTIGGMTSEEHIKIALYEVDDDGNVIKYFKSFADADREYQLQPGSARRGTMREDHYAVGHYWYKAEGFDHEIGDNIGKQYNNFLRATYQFDLYGNLLKKYKSTEEASRETGILQSNIWRALNGAEGCRQSGGYLWSYTEMPPDYDPSINYNKLKSCKKIVQLTLDDKFVKEFPSLNSAATEISRSPSSITACLKGKHKICGGYKWVYAKDYYDKEVGKDGWNS